MMNKTIKIIATATAALMMIAGVSALRLRYRW